MQITKKVRRLRRAVRSRAKIRQLGTARLCVHRTPRHIYAQVLDASGGRVIAAASTVQESVAKGLEGTGNVEAAKAAFKDVLTPQVVEALTASGEVPLLRVLGALGARLKEHRPPTNGTPANVLMTSEVAKARMAQLRTDKAWMQSHADGDTAKRTEWAELQRIAFGE